METKNTNDALNNAVEKALELAEKTGNFVIEQAPDLLQQFYNWHLAKAIIGCVIGLLIMIIGYNIRKLWGKKIDKDYDAGWDEVVIGGYVSEEVSTWVTIIIGLIGGFITLAVNLYNLVFILVAPKLYLIEYFVK